MIHRTCDARSLTLLALLLLLALPSASRAHPLVDNALDVVIAPDRITIDARISMEQVLVIETAGQPAPPRQRYEELARRHAPYVLRHLRVLADLNELSGAITLVSAPPASGDGPAMAAYRLEYPLPAAAPPPRGVRLEHRFLSESDAWSVSCVLRVRQSNESDFQSALLPRGRPAEFGCEWPPTAAGTPAPSTSAHITTSVRLWPTIRAYVAHGVMHILTGYDHLLFVSALVLAARGLWDLIKVVSAFTVAHTLTLVLSVLNIVTLGERIVEPMIALSIVFVAVQNVLSPRQSRGWSRLGIAFGFGLFHGLGFAGGLRDAMSEMPVVALGLALASFSLGVELGHQMVVLPLYAVLRTIRRSGQTARRREAALVHAGTGEGDAPPLLGYRDGHEDHALQTDLLAARLLKFGSCGIAVAGGWFLVQAIRM